MNKKILDGLVTVIMPTYNNAKFLPKAISSILNQTYSNLELIIIDDGSTDGTKDICDGFLEVDSRVRYIIQKNLGVSSARNLGLDNATGKYVIFVDSDDYIDSNMIETLIKEQKVGLIGCGVTVVKEGGKYLKLHRKSCYSTDNFLECFFRSEIQGFSFGYLFELKKCPRFNIKTGYCEDVLFLIDYIVNNNVQNIYYTMSTSYYYRDNKNSVTNTHDDLKNRFTDINISFSAVREKINKKFEKSINNKIIELYEYEMCHGRCNYKKFETITQSFSISKYHGGKKYLYIFSFLYRKKIIFALIIYCCFKRMIKSKTV